MTLIRKQLQITSKQEDFLKQEKGKRDGVSESDIVREALDMYMEAKKGGNKK